MKKKLSILTVVAFATALTMLVLVAGPGSALATDYQYCPGDWTGPGSDGCLTMQQLADIQPGLGTVMIEVGYRNWVINFAARGGNWDMADYQAKEMDEIMEVGTITRPGHAAELLNFMDVDGLPQLRAAINNQDLGQFDTAQANEISQCNSCHVGTGHGYVQWVLPSETPPGMGLAMTTLQSDVTLSIDAAYWDSMADYQAGILSVNYVINNNSSVADAFDVQIVGTSNTNSVTSADIMPVMVGNIAAGGNAGFTLTYNVPSGVMAFSNMIQAQAQDSNGFTYNFPA